MSYPAEIRRLLPWDAAAIALVLVAGALLYHRAKYYPELAYDESASILGMSVLHGHFGNRSDPGGISFSRYYVMDCYPPVYYLATAAVFRLAGFGLIQARAVSVLFVAATALLCYAAGRRHGGVSAGLLALAFYLYVPWRVYNLVARPDVAVPFFLLASVLVLLEGWRSPAAWKFGAAGLLYGLAVLSHYGGLMAAPLMVPLAWFLGQGDWKARALRCLAFVACLAAPIVAFLLYSRPYTDAIFKGFVNYSHYGSSEATGLANRWPFRPTLQHFAAVRAWHPKVLFGLLPLCVAVAAAAALWPAARRRITVPGAVITATFLGLFVLVGTYPNIITYGYYGPFYLVFGAVAAGFGLAAVLPDTTPRASALGKGMALACVLLPVAGLWKKGRLEIASVHGIPLSAIEDWTYRLASDLRYPTLAGSQWVFSAAGDRVMSSRLVMSYGGVLDVNRELKALVPNATPLEAYRTIISDQYEELANVSMMMAHGSFRERLGPEGAEAYGFLASYRLETGEFEAVAMLRDGYRVSGNVALLRRIADHARSAPWPRIARTTPQGPEEQSLEDGCIGSVSVTAPLAPTVSGLWAVALRVEGLPALQENLLLARVVLRPAGNEGVLAPGFCIYYPTAEREQWGSAAIGSWTLPAADAAGAAAITGLRLPTGERGRDLLLAPGPVGAGGRLVTYALGPAVLERIDLALALRPGEECSAGVQRRFARVLKRVSVPKRLPPALLRGAESGRVGEPISILLSEPAPVEFLVFLDGALVGRERVEGTVKPSIVLSRPGQYGIEVWITDPREGTRTLERIFPTVGP